MTKDAVPSLPTATTVGVEAPTLKSTARTPKKPKGWKKWKRRLSQVFTGKKKGKHKQLQQSTTATTGGDPTLPVAQRDLPLRQSKIRRSDRSTDDSPDGSEKEADRRSTDSRELRRKPGGLDRRSDASRSASEPTDEEWEAEQRRLARRDGGDDDEERSYAEEEDDEDELEYDDEEYENERNVGAQSDNEEEELQEDVYDYDDGEAVGEAPLQPEEATPDVIPDANQEDASGGMTPNKPLERTLPLENAIGNAMLNASVDSASGENSEDVAIDGGIEHNDDSDKSDGEQEDDPRTTHEFHAEPDDSCDEDVSDEPQDDFQLDELCPEGTQEDQQQAQQAAEASQQAVEEEENDDAEEYTEEVQEEEEEEDEDEQDDRQHEGAEQELDDETNGVGSGVEHTPSAPHTSLGDLASRLQSIPSDMEMLREVLVWCLSPHAPKTVDSRLLMACINHEKWVLAQQLAEKLMRGHKRAHGGAPTETLLDSVLTFCAA